MNGWIRACSLWVGMVALAAGGCGDDERPLSLDAGRQDGAANGSMPKDGGGLDTGMDGGLDAGGWDGEAGLDAGEGGADVDAAEPAQDASGDGAASGGG